ncbi:acyl carrier protein [Amycolatopsis palatopharyngis]|uniref:acyl carrier protein n=1 Tax=Amycolatopsis palatopharyngis TaxID=187982 RepID=UPI000E24A1C5|nr:acyl carrier protein [Amycolatopsis palatopharyngis]
MTVSLEISAIRDELREHLAEVLYLDVSEIDDDTTFRDLGLDSVLGVELVSVINAKYNLTELVEAVFEHPTLNKLVSYISERATGPS